MANRIRILIADPSATARRDLGLMLGAQPDLELVGAATDGVQSLQMARELQPDILLVNVELSDMDGLKVSETLNREASLTSVVLLSQIADPAIMRRAMVAGARDVLPNPPDPGELLNTMRRVYRLESTRKERLYVREAGGPGRLAHREAKILCMFSPKGGVGCTTIACNLAIALRQLTGAQVALADMNLPLGDVGVMLNLSPTKSMKDLIPAFPNIGPDELTQVMLEHSSGIKVLLGPPRPEMAELFTPDHVRAVLAELRKGFDYVVVDTWTTFHDSVLTIFDVADQIVLITTMDMPAVKNIRMFLEICDALGYGHDKVLLTLNRADSTGAVTVKDMEESLKRKVAATLVSAGSLVTASINRGIPFIISKPESTISENVRELARMVLSEEDASRFASQAAAKGASGTVRGDLSLAGQRVGSKKGAG